jgi:hypothetical protein
MESCALNKKSSTKASVVERKYQSYGSIFKCGLIYCMALYQCLSAFVSHCQSSLVAWEIAMLAHL